MYYMDIFSIINCVLATIGIIICYSVRCQKRGNKPMVCPLGADCSKVLNSDFSKFFGIGLEYLGAIYYSIILIGYALYITLFPDHFELLLGLGIISTVGLLFSIYLTLVQMLTIKSWCTWCLGSAGITAGIFVVSALSIASQHLDLIALVKEYKVIFVLLHLFGFALGLGGATVTDILFFRFLKDFKISESENEILSIMSNIIWFGLAIAILSGIGLYFGNMEVLNETPKFLVKVVIVGIILVNGIFLNLMVAPRLVTMSFKNSKELKNTLPIRRASRLRKYAFAGGAISFVSWYTTAILGGLKKVPYDFMEIFTVYILILAIAIVASQIFEKLYCANRD